MKISMLFRGVLNIVLLHVAALIGAPLQEAQGVRTSGNGTTSAASSSSACADSVADQAGPGCLHASSSPVSGRLFPYPGSNNTFTAPSAVVAGEYSSASGSMSFVGGGFYNVASGSGAVIGGGSYNTASASATTIGGGVLCTASGAKSTIGGGEFNRANALFATIGGGDFNAAYGYAATVGGGQGNTASGARATVCGGRSNVALGDYSFAAGRRAEADHFGSFVWADGYNVARSSSASNQFNVYASGGTRIFSDINASTGVLLAPGGGSWTSVSDRDSKENLGPVDAREVLERLVEIPVSTWNYKEQDDAIRHMGPMAQDFFAAFGLGLGDRTIDTIDSDGVTLAAIQGLNEKLAEERAEREQLAAVIAMQDTEIGRLRADLEVLREALATLPGATVGPPSPRQAPQPPALRSPRVR